jgi:transcriptional regulator with XRE-family HTH domain
MIGIAAIFPQRERGVMPNRLRILRAERNLPQYKLAISSGIDHTRYWRIEHGLVSATDGERAQIAAALGVSVRQAWPRSVSRNRPAQPAESKTSVSA